MRHLIGNKKKKMLGDLSKPPNGILVVTLLSIRLKFENQLIRHFN